MSKLSQLQNEKHLNLRTITSLAIYLLNRGKSSYIIRYLIVDESE